MKTKEIKLSDERIAKAIVVLQDNHRGQIALRDFKTMMKNGALGLDTDGMKALVSLLKEVQFGRRDFLDGIHF